MPLGPLPDLYITARLLDRLHHPTQGLSLNLGCQVAFAARHGFPAYWLITDIHGNGFQIWDNDDPRVAAYCEAHYVEVEGTLVNPTAVLLAQWIYPGFWIQTVTGRELSFKDGGAKALDALVEAGLLQISHAAAVNPNRVGLYDPSHGDLILSDYFKALRRCHVLVDSHLRIPVAKTFTAIDGWTDRPDGALVNLTLQAAPLVAAAVPQVPLVIAHPGLSKA